MAKNAASEGTMGALHLATARVFQKVLDKYLKQMELLDSPMCSDEVMAGVIAELGEPNPAMMAAITKFLKDNDISFSAEEVDSLAEKRELLEQRKRSGKSIANLVQLRAVAAENG